MSTSTDRTALSAELRLLLACCARPERSGGDIATAAAAVRDWPLLERLVVHHRIAGFVVRALTPQAHAVPTATWQAIAALARTGAEQNLRNVAEEQRIDDALRATGVAPLFLKGSGLGRKLYGNLSTKTSWDIDVVVPPAHIARCAGLLAELGYRPEGFCGITGGAAFDRYLAVAMESVWHNAGRGTFVELHSRITTYPGLLDAPLPRQPLMPGGGRIETLADGALFAYLAVHGVGHGWERMKWLADLAALVAVSPHGPGDLLDMAEALGAGRPAGAGLLLCHDLLGAPMPTDVLDRCRSRRAVRTLADFGAATLARSGIGTPDRLLGPITTWRMHMKMVAGPIRKARLGWSILAGLRWPFQLWLPRAVWPVTAVVVSPFRLALRRRRIVAG